MIHFSCDRCRRSISEEELRFTVSIEVQVALDANAYSLDEANEDLGELQAILMQFEDDELRDEISQYAYQRRQFDMCFDCHREYLKDPLSIEAPARVGFSEN